MGILITCMVIVVSLTGGIVIILRIVAGLYGHIPVFLNADAMFWARLPGSTQAKKSSKIIFLILILSRGF